MKPHWNAIPTTYAGHEFKSRFEANVAQTLDRLGVKWEYEAKSFLLADGTHFMPDFWLPELNAWLETRGYSNLKGDRQLSGFPSAMEPGHIFLAAVLKEDSWPHNFIKIETHPERAADDREQYVAAHDLTKALEEALCEMGYCPFCADPEKYEQAFADAFEAAGEADRELWAAQMRRPRKHKRIYGDLATECYTPIYAESDLPLRSERERIWSGISYGTPEPAKQPWD